MTTDAEFAETIEVGGIFYPVKSIGDLGLDLVPEPVLEREPVPAFLLPVVVVTTVLFIASFFIGDTSEVVEPEQPTDTWIFDEFDPEVGATQPQPLPGADQFLPNGVEGGSSNE